MHFTWSFILEGLQISLLLMRDLLGGNRVSQNERANASFEVPIVSKTLEDSTNKKSLITLWHLSVYFCIHKQIEFFNSMKFLWFSFLFVYQVRFERAAQKLVQMQIPIHVAYTKLFNFHFSITLSGKNVKKKKRDISTYFVSMRVKHKLSDFGRWWLFCLFIRGQCVVWSPVPKFYYSFVRTA